MKILLADDDQSLRRVLQFKLKKHGHEVTAVDDGAKALERLSAGQWDLLISDVKMPNVDGIELLEQSMRLQPGLKVRKGEQVSSGSSRTKWTPCTAHRRIQTILGDDESRRDDR
jgi:CheY-like chemotaxis protein